MKIDFRYITDKFEKPMLGGNETWCTNIWLYIITGLVGAISGWGAMKSSFGDATFSQAVAMAFNFGLLYTLVCWCGCTAMAFVQIPDTKMATRRSIFNLVAIALIYYACAILSVLAVIAICLLIILFFMSAGASSGKSSSSATSSEPDEVYDGEGNRQYVEKTIGRDRIQTNDGRTMRREADGTYRDI